MLDFETLGPVARRKFMDNRKLFYAAGLCSAAVDGKREGKGKSAGHVGGGGRGQPGCLPGRAWYTSMVWSNRNYTAHYGQYGNPRTNGP